MRRLVLGAMLCVGCFEPGDDASTVAATIGEGSTGTTSNGTNPTQPGTTDPATSDPTPSLETDVTADPSASSTTGEIPPIDGSSSSGDSSSTTGGSSSSSGGSSSTTGIMGCVWIDILECDTMETIATYCPAGTHVERLINCVDGGMFSPDDDYQMFPLCGCDGFDCGCNKIGVLWEQIECCED